MPALRSHPEHTLHTFDDISRFLREGVADEDSRQLRESLGSLSEHIDEAFRTRHGGTDANAVTRCVVRLAQCAREHQLLLTGLGSGWHVLYEFGAYQRALGELRAAIAAWQQALERHSSKEGACFAHFERLAWRTLGEALLLIDMYEHDSGSQNDPPDTPPPPRRASGWQRARAWLKRLAR